MPEGNTITSSTREAHEGAIEQCPWPMSIAEIQAATADAFGIKVGEMKSHRRAAARARQVAMYLARELTPASYPQIGRMFGNRDHTTVSYGCRVIEAFIGSDAAFAGRVERLKSRLQSGSGDRIAA